MNWKKDDFIWKEALGSGANSKVVRAIEKHTKKEVAIKLIPIKKIVELKADHYLRREIEIQYHLKSSNEL